MYISFWVFAAAVIIFGFLLFLVITYRKRIKECEDIITHLEGPSSQNDEDEARGDDEWGDAEGK